MNGAVTVGLLHLLHHRDANRLVPPVIEPGVLEEGAGILGPLLHGNRGTAFVVGARYMPVNLPLVAFRIMSVSALFRHDGHQSSDASNRNVPIISQTLAVR